MFDFDTIQGTAYSCEADKGVLGMKKSTLDYHTQNIGTSTKSNITPAKLKLLELDYETAKKKYDASPCGKDPERDACIALQSAMTMTRASIAYHNATRDYETANQRTASLEQSKKNFEDKKCGAKIGEFRADAIKSITDIYGGMDKQRIEEDSKYQAKQRIFFGALVFLGAVLMVTMFGKKE
jgi:hypothetical protein